MANDEQEIAILSQKGMCIKFNVTDVRETGRVTRGVTAIRFKEDGEESDIYIGITHVEDKLNYYVHDWRSPICSMFYDFETGPAYYKDTKNRIDGEIIRKRKYIIKN